MFLGIDLGTSGVKAIVLAEDGTIAAQGSAPLGVSRRRPLWAEQDPQDWWRATDAAVRALDPRFRSQVRAIGLAGQMHGATLLGVDDGVLRPAILWNDGRSMAECAELETAEPASRQITGNLAMPGFTAPKLAWVRRHEPEVFAQVALVLLPKDWLRLKLTGEKASDVSDAAGTLWLDVALRDWSDAMLAATGLSRLQMPRVHEGPDVTGTLLGPVAASWGMDRVPVVAGAGDNAAGAVGVGVVEDGDSLLSLGTSGVTFVATRDFRPTPERAVHAFCHCLPGMWHQMAVHLSAASCVDWAARQLGLGGPEEFFTLAQQASSARGPELFLPFLSGERTPHNNPHLRAGWLALDHETSPARLASAVLEGVAFAHADGIAALRAAGTRVERLSLIGGGARSHHWGRILAAAIGAEIDYLDGGEVGPALGAARLARMGVSRESADMVCTRPAVLATITPDPGLAEALSIKLDHYRAAIAALPCS
jgi:xylulokinase